MEHSIKADCFTRKLLGFISDKVKNAASSGQPLTVSEKTKSVLNTFIQEYAQQYLETGYLQGFKLEKFDKLLPLSFNFSLVFGDTKFIVYAYQVTEEDFCYNGLRVGDLDFTIIEEV